MKQTKVISNNLNEFTSDKIMMNSVLLNSVSNALGVYIFKKTNGLDKIYIGQALNIKNRVDEHLRTGEKIDTSDELTYYTSDFFNSSVIYDLETRLIEHARFLDESLLLNVRLDQKEYTYYQKEQYKPLIEEICKEFNEDIKDLIRIERYKEYENFESLIGSTEYKIAPTKLSTKAQDEIENSIVDKIKEDVKDTVFTILGLPGTGKTVMATKLFKKLIELYPTKKILLTSGIPHLNYSFKKTMNKYMKNTNAIIQNPGSFINKSRKTDKKFDIIIVDEGHRLKRARTGKASHLSTQHIHSDYELQDLLQYTNNAIVVFDENQIAMPADNYGNHYKVALALSGKKSENYMLHDNLRNNDYFGKFVNQLLSDKLSNISYDKTQSSVEIIIHNTFHEFYNALQIDKQNWLDPRIVSTPGRENNRKSGSIFHFDYGDIKLKWSHKPSSNKSWVDTEQAINLKEVGYYNNIQGFEFDSIGVIIDNDICYDEIQDKISYNKNFSINHFQYDPDESFNLELALNRLRILLTRTTKRLHLFVEDEKLNQTIKNDLFFQCSLTITT